MRFHAPGRGVLAALSLGIALGIALAPQAARAENAPHAAPAPPRGETAAARDQARLCERLDGEEALAACREALALGIANPRRAAIRLLLSRRLAALERWEELAALLRDSVRLDPADAVSWHRLGAVLLYALDRPAEGVAAFEQAVALSPDEALPRVDLAVALASAGRLPECVSAFAAAEARDPAALAALPAARAVRDAAREGRRWPQ